MYTTIFSNYKKSLILEGSTIPEVVKSILAGNTIIHTRAARRAGKGSKLYDQLKVTLLAFTPHGQFKGSKNKDLIKLSGYVYLDVDGQELDIDYLRSIPCLYAYWRSLSGKGYSLLFKVDVSTYTAKDINKVILAIAQEYNIPLDKNAKSLNRAVCIPSDPDAYINGSVTDYVFNSVNDTLLNDDKYNSIEGIICKKNKTKKTESAANDTFDLLPIPDFSEDQYVEIFNKPLKVIETYRRRIPVGNRYNTLSQIAHNIVALYSEMDKRHPGNFTDEHAYREFLTFEVCCEEQIGRAEMFRIFGNALIAREENRLHVTTRLRYGRVNPELPVEIRRGAGGYIRGAVARKKTETLLKTEVNKIIVEEGQITQRVVAEATGKSLPTIKRYWKFVQAIIEKNHSKPSESQKVQIPAAKEIKQLESAKQAVLEEEPVVESFTDERVEFIRALITKGLAEKKEQNHEPVEEIPKPEEGSKELTLEERTELVLAYLRSERFTKYEIYKTEAEAVLGSLFLKEVDGDLHVFRVDEGGDPDPLNGEEMYREWLKKQAGIIEEEPEELPF